jgi:group I intron endonuclease
MCGYIYGLQSPNGKWYIGQTTMSDPYDYIRETYKYRKGKGRPKIRDAITRYGFDNFNVLLLDHKDSIEALNEAEIYYIRLYNGTVFGYNCSEGGRNAKLTDEAKLKLRMCNLGKKRSKETVEKIRLGNTGKKWTAEQKKRLSMSQKALNKKLTPEQIDIIRKANIGRKGYWTGKRQPDEVIQRMRDTKKRLFKDGVIKPYRNVWSQDKLSHPRTKIRSAKNIVTGEVVTGCLTVIGKEKGFLASNLTKRGYSGDWILVKEVA